MPDEFPLAHRGLAAAGKPALDHAVFKACALRLVFHGFLVRFAAQVIDAVVREQQRGGPLEGVEQNPLIAHPAAPQPVHVHAHNGVPAAGFNLVQQLRHARALRDGVAGDDVLINR